MEMFRNFDILKGLHNTSCSIYYRKQCCISHTFLPAPPQNSQNIGGAVNSRARLQQDIIDRQYRK